MGKWLIAEWREAWRFTSLWVGALAIGVLSAWDFLPDTIRAELLGRYKLEIGVLLWVALVVSRISRQPISQAAIDAKRAAAQADDYRDWSDQARG